jgi:ATP-dependent DNA helicase DinG
MSLLDDFPCFKCYPREEQIYPRKEQVRILEEIERLIDCGYKTIFIQAPPGVGKSPIAVAILRHYGGYVCTSTKSLQNQYLQDFPELAIVKGRGNYNCISSGSKRTCDQGLCSRGTEIEVEKDSKLSIVKSYTCEKKPIPLDEEWGIGHPSFAAQSASRGNLYWQSAEHCDYWSAKVNGLSAKGAILNYKFLIKEANNVGDFGTVNVLISDEGHNVEKEIAETISVNVSQKDLDQLNHLIGAINDLIKDISVSEDLKLKKVKFKQTDKKEAQHVLLYTHFSFIINLQNTLTDLKEFLDPEKKYKEKINNYLLLKAKNEEEYNANMQEIEGAISTIENLSDKIGFLITDQQKNPDNWVVKEIGDKLNAGSKIESIEFNPVFIRQYAYDKYFRLGLVNIIMSATILDYKKLAYNLGFDPSEVGYIDIDPVFPVENNKVFLLRLVDLKLWKFDTEQDIEDLYRQVTEKIDLLLDLHPIDKGIIHANTNEICKYIHRFTCHKNRILTHNTANRNEILMKHKESVDPTVLCSPSMTEGVDLPDDQSRFQIIIKIPYAYLGDARVRKRMDLDQDFYDLHTAVVGIQAIGRSVRSHDDYAVTYIIDKRFERFQKMDDSIVKYVNPLFTRYIRSNTELFDMFQDPDDFDGWWPKYKHEYLSWSGKVHGRIIGTGTGKISKLLEPIRRPWKRPDQMDEGFCF